MSDWARNAGTLLLLAAVGWSRPLAAQDGSRVEVPVEVIEVAGGRAYVSPGESGGVRRGDDITFRGGRFRVIGATASTAIVDLRGRRIKVGARGQALINPNPTDGPKTLEPPQALAAWSGQWPHAKLPADTQHPKLVPLGPMDSAGRSRLMLSAGGAGVFPLSGSASTIARGEVRARLRYEPLHELPLRLDADVAAQVWLADNLDSRDGGATRTIARVRELQASYGGQAELFAALGRMRYASRTLGMLDGARLQVPIYGGITLGAFGGFVPDPLDGKPTTDTSRFGAELGFEDLTLGARPRVALTAHGSRFDGALDDRKLDAFVDLFPGDSRVGSYVELSFYDQDNPWNAPAQEVSAAGADTSVRIGVLELGARLDMQRPERSRWLAAFLPPGWLCSTRSLSPSVAGEPCYGDDARYMAAGDVGLRFARLSVTVGSSLSTTEHADAQQVGGFLGASLLQVVEQVRVDASLMTSNGSLVQTMAASIGAGSPLMRGLLDVSVHYRPALTRYDVDNARFLEHTLGADIVLSPSAEVDLSVNADAITGGDIDVLLVQTLLAWRPSI